MELKGSGKPDLIERFPTNPKMEYLDKVELTIFRGPEDKLGKYDP